MKLVMALLLALASLTHASEYSPPKKPFSQWTAAERAAYDKHLNGRYVAASKGLASFKDFGRDDAQYLRWKTIAVEMYEIGKEEFRRREAVSRLEREKAGWWDEKGRRIDDVKGRKSREERWNASMEEAKEALWVASQRFNNREKIIDEHVVSIGFEAQPWWIEASQFNPEGPPKPDYFERMAKAKKDGPAEKVTTNASTTNASTVSGKPQSVVPAIIFIFIVVIACVVFSKSLAKGLTTGVALVVLFPIGLVVIPLAIAFAPLIIAVLLAAFIVVAPVVFVFRMPASGAAYGLIGFLWATFRK